jgi:hypothetical protein
MPADPAFVFQRFYDRLQGARLRHLSRQADSRRQLPHRLHRPARRDGHAGALDAVRAVLAEMGVAARRRCARSGVTREMPWMARYRLRSPSMAAATPGRRRRRVVVCIDGSRARLYRAQAMAAGA